MDDDKAVRARLSDSAAAAASRAYEAAYGNPISTEARGVRWRLDWRVAATVAAVAIAALAVAWLQRVGAAPELEPLPAASASADAPLAAPVVIVHVAGAVREPGVFELEPGSRVADAIAAAGGPARKADTGAVNLARPVVDGEQVFVPKRGASGGGQVNVNQASASELETLPGIGPALAARIVADRQAHGPFARLDDLARVAGIGDAVVSGLEGVATT